MKQTGLHMRNFSWIILVLLFPMCAMEDGSNIQGPQEWKDSVYILDGSTEQYTRNWFLHCGSRRMPFFQRMTKLCCPCCFDEYGRCSLSERERCGIYSVSVGCCCLLSAMGVYFGVTQGCPPWSL